MLEIKISGSTPLEVLSHAAASGANFRARGGAYKVV